jgi:diaminopimelate decarboxylase
MTIASPQEYPTVPSQRDLPSSRHTSELAAQLVDKYFSMRTGSLHIGGLNVASIADLYGSPLFIYDAEVMRRSYRSLYSAVAGFAEIFYSIKANPNPAVASVFLQEGAGAEIASKAEFEIALRAGAKPNRILFAGPGKSDADLDRVIAGGIGEIHLENMEELQRVAALGASHGKRIEVAIRINPSPSARGGAMRMGGRPSPFGFDEEDIDIIVDTIETEPWLDLRGIHLFTGTQILSAETLIMQWEHALSLARHVGARIGRPLSSIDLGGGLGIPYFEGDDFLDLNIISAGVSRLKKMVADDPWLRSARVILEPGRFLVGPSGVYVARVRAVKQSRGTRFIITDGGMHHHLSASGNLGQVFKRDFPIVALPARPSHECGPAQIVGPLCTPLDVLARSTVLPELASGDLIVVMQSGAYALTASPNNFLSHPRPPEVLVDQDQAILISPEW